MDLRAYFAVIRRRIVIVAATVIVSMGAAVAATMLMPPSYRASATLRLATPRSEAAAGRYHLDYADRLLNTYARLVAVGWARRTLAPTLEVTEAPRFGAEIIANTELIRVTAEHPDPTVAATAANALAALLQETSLAWTGAGQPPPTGPSPGEGVGAPPGEGEPRLPVDGAAIADPPPAGGDQAPGSAGLAQEPETVTLELVEAADEPNRPAGPGTATVVGLALALGLVGGLGLGFLREGLDTAIHDSRQLAAATGVRVLGHVPRLARAVARRPASLDKDVGEEFRRLLFLLRGADQGSAPKTVMVASAEERAGKTTVVTGLAVAAAREGQCVLAVDCDLESPELHMVFDLKPLTPSSATEVDYDDSPGDLVRHSRIPGLDVLPTGRSFPHGMATVQRAEGLSAYLDQLRPQYDLILIDTPPLRTTAGAMALAPRVDGVLLVASVGQSREGPVRQAVDQLSDGGARLLGAVANRLRS